MVQMKGGLAKVALCVPRGHGHCWFPSPGSGRGWIPFSGQTPCQEAACLGVARLILTGTSLGITFDIFSAFLGLLFLLRRSRKGKILFN